MKKKKILPLLLFVFVSWISNLIDAQSISRKVNSSAGGTLSGGGNQITFNIGETLIPALSGGSITVTQGFEQPGEDLQTGKIISPLCAGSAIDVPFTAIDMGGGNVFTALLSDSAGSFDSAEVIGTLSGFASGIIAANIPSNTQSGYHYRILVTSSFPSLIGQDNGADLIINLPTNSTVPTLSTSTTPICGNTLVSLSIASGSLNGAKDWNWYNGSCGGTYVGSGTSISVSPNSTTDFFARAEGGCVNHSNCGKVTVTVTGAGIPTSANVLTGNTTINTQTELDAFFNSGNGNKWTKVSGDLTINGNSNIDPITSFCNLSSLTEVSGYLLIQQFTKSGNPNSLSDLATLSKVGRLNIITNPQFQTITLPNLLEATSSVMVRNNSNVKTISFPKLQSIKGDLLHIQRNYRAEIIMFSDSVNSFEMPNPKSNVDIQKNGDSTSTPLTMNFKKFTKIGRDLTFSLNKNSGVNNFDSIFSGLDSVKGKLTITDNTYLTKCCVAANAVVMGTRTITGNTGNCYDLTAVISNCGSLHKRNNQNPVPKDNFTYEVNLTPNPTNGQFDLNIIPNEKGILNISINDIMGRALIGQSIQVDSQKTISFDITSYPSGQYIIKTEINGISHVNRIMLVK